MPPLICSSNTKPGSRRSNVVGGQLLGIVPTPILLPLLALILVFLAFKIWGHK